MKRMHAERAVLVLSLTVLVTSAAAAAWSDRWTPGELAELRSLWLHELPPLPPDPTNRIADDPTAVTLGHRLFFDTRMSANGRVSCATCHLPELEFQDGTPLATGVGTTDRRTMPIQGTAHAPFLLWDGRKDSQWAQALGPLENPVEHGATRAQLAHLVAMHYRDEYEALLGPLPDLSGIPSNAGPVDDLEARAAWEALSDRERDAVTEVFVNLGKAIAAYERQLSFGPSRFDRYVAELDATGVAPAGVLSPDEVAGLRLFIGKANCTQCHNGPLFTNNDFHNTGVPPVPSLPPDRGRLVGARRVMEDEFNCRSRWSDGAPASCPELDFLAVEGPELARAFKVPSLRNVADRPPYMHAGQFADLARALVHYDRAPAGPSGHTELRPLRLRSRERRQLESFLRALSGGTHAPPELLRAPRPLLDEHETPP